MKALLIKCPPGTEPADLVVLPRSTVERAARELRACGFDHRHHANERVVARAVADALFRTLAEQRPVALLAPVASPPPDPDSSPKGGAT